MAVNMESQMPFTSFTITQPFLGAPLQFSPALGSKELESLIDAYVPGPGAKQDKLSTVTIDFYNHATVDINTGALVRRYDVYPSWATSSFELSPSQSQSSGLSPAIYTPSPASSTTFDSSFGAISTPPLQTRGARVSKKSKKESKKSSEIRLPGFSIMTKDGVDVTNSAGRGTKTKEQREHAHLMRIIKACDACKRKKIRCDPSHRLSSHVDMSRSSTTKTSSSSPSRSGPSPAASTPSLSRETTQGSEHSSPSADASFALEDFVLFPEDDSNQWNAEFETQYNDLSLMDFNQFPDFDPSYFASMDVLSSFGAPSSSQSSFSSTQQLAGHNLLPDHDHVQSWAYANINSQSVSPVESQALSTEDLNFFDSSDRSQGDDRVHHTVHLRNAQDTPWNMVSPVACVGYGYAVEPTHTRHIHEANSSTHLRLADGDPGTMHAPAAAGYAQEDTSTNRGAAHTSPDVHDSSQSPSAAQTVHVREVLDEHVRDLQEGRRKRNRKLASDASALASTGQGRSALPSPAQYSPEGYTETAASVLGSPTFYYAPRPIDPQYSPVINQKVNSGAVRRTPSSDVVVSIGTALSVWSPATVLNDANDTYVAIQPRVPFTGSSFMPSHMSSPRSRGPSDALVRLPCDAHSLRTGTMLPDTQPRREHLQHLPKHSIATANAMSTVDAGKTKSQTTILATLEKHASPSVPGKIYVTTPSKPTVSLLAALVVGLGVPIVGWNLLQDAFVPIIDVLATILLGALVASRFLHGSVSLSETTRVPIAFIQEASPNVTMHPPNREQAQVQTRLRV
ncbi:transcription factor Cys6 protein [Rutstroemia sp. NJR-2017a WRK4]|nr:transcription factor Cys6 protein [Rutstroemia sp. NJR-2017a WRK4]